MKHFYAKYASTTSAKGLLEAIPQAFKEYERSSVPPNLGGTDSEGPDSVDDSTIAQFVRRLLKKLTSMPHFETFAFS